MPLQHTAYSLSETLGQCLLQRCWHVATAESCTGGGIAAAITSVAGSSAWFECGVVSYANSVKQKLLQVTDQSLLQYGAVSEAVVNEMIDGILNLSNADIAVAVSGIAGPGGGSLDKPVGTLWFAWGTASGERRSEKICFSGDRQQIQQQGVEFALSGLLSFFK